MLIAISHPESLANESILINRLFEEGLAIFHLRKPNYTIEKLAELLNEIEPIHLSKIALHQHHELSKHFNIKRLHYTEERRQKEAPKTLAQKVKEGYLLSSSIHDITTYDTIEEHFAYLFLGPIFNSISKTSYKAISAEKRQMKKSEKQIKLIAIGGINAQNCHLPLEWGFDGIAMLGSLWAKDAQTIDVFKNIKQEVTQTYSKIKPNNVINDVA